MRRCLATMSGNRADAEDALSEAMLLAARKFSSYADRIRNERAWLAKLAYNTCIDLHRTVRRRDRALAEGKSNVNGQWMGRAWSAQATPEELLIGRQAIADMDQAIRRLPANLRRPFVLRILGECSYGDIAERLGLTPATARKRIQSARARLRETGPADIRYK